MSILSLKDMKLCGFRSVCTKSISNTNMNCPFNHHEHLSIYVKCDKKKKKKKRGRPSR